MNNEKEYQRKKQLIEKAGLHFVASQYVQMPGDHPLYSTYIKHDVSTSFKLDDAYDFAVRYLSESNS